MTEVAEILKKIPKLKPLPDTAMKIIKAVNDPTASVEDIVETIKYDQVLTGKVLRICNSAYMGLDREITSLKEALMYMGTKRLTQIILLAVPDSPLMDKVEGYGLAQGDLWIHSAGTAIAAQNLGSTVKYPDPNLLFTAGLLHDIGKCLLQEYVGKEYENLIIKVDKEGLDFAEAERELFDVDHAEVGAQIGEQWNFPGEIVKVIRFHHRPNDCGETDQAVDLVFLGDLLSMLMGRGLGKDGLFYKGNSEVMERNGLKPESLEKACAELVLEIKSLSEFMLPK